MDNTNIYIFIIFVILIALVANYFLNTNKRELDHKSNNISSTKYEISKKNKYLFPEEGFGKMEKGRTTSNSKEIYARGRKKIIPLTK